MRFRATRSDETGFEDIVRSHVPKGTSAHAVEFLSSLGEYRPDSMTKPRAAASGLHLDHPTDPVPSGLFLGNVRGEVK